MNTAEQRMSALSELLTWPEICERYPDQHVCFVELERPHASDTGERVARVIAHGTTRHDVVEQVGSSSESYPNISLRFTGRSRTPLQRPSVVLDDETRNAFRIRW